MEIPQADEQQRLLVNLINEINADRKPLPRFWYLPEGLKAAVVMTGDDHGNGGTAGRFDQLEAASPAGCSVADWECFRGTSYIFPEHADDECAGAAFAARARDRCAPEHRLLGLHAASLAADTTTTSGDLAGASTRACPSRSTNRTHCIAWSDWSTMASVELAPRASALDTNYYYWPPAWIQNRPGFFTGSGCRCGSRTRPARCSTSTRPRRR